MLPLPYLQANIIVQGELGEQHLAFLERIHFARSLYIFRKNSPVSKKDHKRVAFKLRKDSAHTRKNVEVTPPTQVLFREYRMLISGVYFQRDAPSTLFRDKSLAWSDVKTAFCVLIETDAHVFITKQNVKALPKRVSDKLDLMEEIELTDRFASAGTTVRGVTADQFDPASKQISRASIDAEDLLSELIGERLGRRVLRSCKVIDKGERRSLTSSVSKVHTNGEKVGLVGLLAHVKEADERLVASRPKPNEHLAKYSRKLEFESAGKKHKLKTLQLHGPSIREFFEAEVSECYYYCGLDDRVEVGVDEVLQGLESWSRHLIEIEEDPEVSKIEFRAKKRLGTLGESRLKRNTTSFSLRSAALSKVYITDGSGNELSLEKVINQEQMFVCLTDTPSIIYYGKAFYEDKSFETGVKEVIDALHVIPAFKKTDSEKGKVTKNSTLYSEKCVFGKCVKEIGTRWPNATVIIDDMSAERFDVGAIDQDVVVAIHAKGGKGGTHAVGEALHVVCSQLVKNLGALFVEGADKQTMLERWAKTVEGSQIPRCYSHPMHPCPQEALEAIDAILTRADTPKMMVIAVPSLSKATLAAEFREILDDIDTARKRQYYVNNIQMLWLLMGIQALARRYSTRFQLWCGA